MSRSAESTSESVSVFVSLKKDPILDGVLVLRILEKFVFGNNLFAASKQNLTSNIYHNHLVSQLLRVKKISVELN